MYLQADDQYITISNLKIKSSPTVEIILFFLLNMIDRPDIHINEKQLYIYEWICVHGAGTGGLCSTGDRRQVMILLPPITHHRSVTDFHRVCSCFCSQRLAGGGHSIH